jgi:hypothetical protein
MVSHHFELAAASETRIGRVSRRVCGLAQSRQRIGVAVRCGDQMSPRSAEI